ncbi:YidB family protein [Pantoea sp. LMR881]|uniref:YidB family protein n=1 Tax=Pantoea sp. LMR881 TaxID=3014336 RepID=UPI0022AEBB79|nr:YidB family protein [Pantoea sp. LMR881]MCZ4060272.1 YidB family protein [Pantoea sp. LMR881]
MMGFLDELVGSLGNGQGQGNQPGQLQAIWHWVQEQGGIEVLLHKFQQGGLGEVLGSWIGTGNNQPVGSNEIQSAFGQGELQSLADKLGTDVNGASGTLAALLPLLIDKMSPHGQMDEKSLHANQLDLGSMVDQLFKK